MRGWKRRRVSFFCFRFQCRGSRSARERPSSISWSAGCSLWLDCECPPDSVLISALRQRVPVTPGTPPQRSESSSSGPFSLGFEVSSLFPFPSVPGVVAVFCNSRLSDPEFSCSPSDGTTSEWLTGLYIKMSLFKCLL